MSLDTSSKKPDELSNDGFELMKSGDYDSALPLFLRAAECYAQKNDLKNQAAQLQMISEIYRLTNRINDAVKTCEDLIELYEETKEYEHIFRVLNNIGLLEIGRKNYDVALIRFKSALEVSEKLGNKNYAALQAGNIGSTFRDMKKSDQAIEYYQKALHLYEECGQMEGVADQFTNIAYIHVVVKRFDKALELYQKALPLYMEAKNKAKASFTRQNIEKLEHAINRQ
jgi:tetratricopeptide (TPR) repeat protein